MCVAPVIFNCARSVASGESGCKAPDGQAPESFVSIAAFAALHFRSRELSEMEPPFQQAFFLWTEQAGECSFQPADANAHLGLFMSLFIRELWGYIVSAFQPNLPGPVFDQPDIETMRRALDSASKALAFSYGPAGGPDQGVRTALARAILGQASHGERNPEVLSSLALRELPPRSAYWVRDTSADLRIA